MIARSKKEKEMGFADFVDSLLKPSGLTAKKTCLGMVLSMTMLGWTIASDQIQAIDPVLRLKEISELVESDPELISIAGDLNCQTFDSRECLARLKLTTQEPILKSRIPGLQCFADASEISQSYQGGDYLNPIVPGEKVTISFQQAGKTLVKLSWSTDFPKKADSLEFLSAPVSGKDLLQKLLLLDVFTQGDLAELANSNIVELQLSAEANLVDDVSLAKVALENKDVGIRCLAIKKLTNQTILAEIAMNDNDDDVRLAALINPCFMDQAILTDIAKNDQNGFIRLIAANKITEQALLTDLATDADDEYVRMVAAGKLTNLSMLAELVNNDVSDRVRRVATVAQLADQVQLTEIAKNDDEDETVRETAVRKISDQAVLAEIADHVGQTSGIRAAAVEKLTDQGLLTHIIKNAHSNDVRMAAIKNLSDQDVLAEIASNDSDSDVSKAAVKKITDTTRLADIAKNCQNEYVRKFAEKRLEDLRLK